jgi:hypothetical protein
MEETTAGSPSSRTTEVTESLKSRATRFMFNLFPCYRRTGVRMTYIAPDFHEVRIKLPLNWKTRGFLRHDLRR